MRGTFSAGSRPAVSGAAAVQELDWVLYTPEGFFDASAEATRLVHYRRPASIAGGRAAGSRPRSGLAVGRRPESRGGRSARPARREAEHLRARRAALAGRGPGQKPASEGAPPITISWRRPAIRPRPEALLKIKMAADNFEEVRLYHNDVPIPSGWDPARKPGPGAGPPSLDVPVKLVSGINRFYAMASRKDAYDSCSRVVEVNYESQAERGQVHVVALGVKDYEARRLRYSEDDAEQLSEFIHSRGLDAAGRQGIRPVLLGNEVSRRERRAGLRRDRPPRRGPPAGHGRRLLSRPHRRLRPPAVLPALPTYPLPARPLRSRPWSGADPDRAPTPTPTTREREGQPPIRPAVLGHRSPTCPGSRPSIAW